MAEAAGLHIPLMTGGTKGMIKELVETRTGVLTSMSGNIERFVNYFVGSNTKEKQEKEKVSRTEDNIRKFSIGWWRDKAKNLQIEKKLREARKKLMLKFDLVKFFKNVGSKLKEMAEKSGGWLMNLLKFLFAVALFDPNGKFLTSIFNFLIKVVVKLINLIAAHLPRIIKTMLFLIRDILPKLLLAVINGIFPALYSMFDTFFKELPVGPLKTVMGFVRDLFGEGSYLLEFFRFLAKNIPTILAIWAGMVVFFKLKAIFMAIGAVVAGLFSWVTLIVIAVAIIGAGIYLLYKNWDLVKKSVSDFFTKTIPEVFDKVYDFLREGVIGFGKFLKNIFLSFLDFIVKGFAGAAKLLIKGIKIYVKTWFKIIETLFIKPIKYAFRFLYRGWQKIWNFIKPGVDKIMEMLSPVIKFFKTILSPLIKLFETIGPPLLKVFQNIKTILVNNVMRVFKHLKNFLGSVVDWVSNISTYGIFWASKSAKEKEKIANTQQMFRTQDVDTNRLERIAEMIAKGKTSEIKKEDKATAQEINELKRQGWDPKERSLAQWLGESNKSKREVQSVIQSVRKIKQINNNKDMRQKDTRKR